jgi:hypothetical protein
MQEQVNLFEVTQLGAKEKVVKQLIDAQASKSITISHVE